MKKSITNMVYNLLNNTRNVYEGKHTLVTLHMPLLKLQVPLEDRASIQVTEDAAIAACAQFNAIDNGDAARNVYHAADASRKIGTIMELAVEQLNASEHLKQKCIMCVIDMTDNSFNVELECSGSASINNVFITTASTILFSNAEIINKMCVSDEPITIKLGGCCETC